MYEILCCVNYCIHVPPDKVTYYLWLLLLFCVQYWQKKFVDAETSRPPTGHHRLASIQDTLTSNVSLCVVCNRTGSCIATFTKYCSNNGTTEEKKIQLWVFVCIVGIGILITLFAWNFLHVIRELSYRIRIWRKIWWFDFKKLICGHRTHPKSLS